MASILEIIVKLDDQASDKSKKIGKSLEDIGGKARKTGLALTAGLTLPLGAMALKSIDAASDLQESVSKVNVVFGENANTILKWSENAAQSFGITRQQALESVGTFGNLFSALKLNDEANQEMSTSLVALASDLASFNNAVPLDVLEALRAGITGEAEPLKKFGINLNQAGIEAKAMAMGLIEDKTELNAAAKAQAAYAIIMEQTALAQGDFIRTSDGLANMQRIVKAQFGDLMAELGENFLPVAESVVSTISDLLSQFQALSPEVKNTILIVGLIVAAIGPLLIIIGQLIISIGAIMPVVSAVGALLSGPLIAVLVIVGLAIATLAMAWKNNWGDIREKTDKALKFIKSIIEKALKFIGNWWKKHKNEIISTILTLWERGKDLFEQATKFLWDLISDFLTTVFKWWNEHKDEIIKTVKSLWDTAKDIFNWASDFIKQVIGDLLKIIMDWWNKYGDDVTELISLVWGILKNLFTAGADIIQKIITTVINIINSIWKNHKDEIISVVTTLWNILKTIIEGVSGIIGGIIQAFIALIKGDWEGFGEALRSVWDTAWNTIKNVVETLSDSIKGIIDKFIEWIKGIFQNTDWAALGRSIIDGIISGARGLGGKLKQAVKNLVSNALKAVRAFLGATSPARMFIPIGESIPLGIIRGIKNYQKEVEEALIGILEPPIRLLAPGVPMGRELLPPPIRRLLEVLEPPTRLPRPILPPPERQLAEPTALQAPVRITNFYITANYSHQPERKLKDDIKRLNALYVGGYR